MPRFNTANARGVLAARTHLFALLTLSFLAPAQAEFVAGTTPDRRPADAPRLTNLDHGDSWQAKALTGVTKPYPSSLHFLNDQGGWFSPFLRPGMTGRYDIRGWHKAASAPTGKP